MNKDSMLSRKSLKYLENIKGNVYLKNEHVLINKKYKKNNSFIDIYKDNKLYYKTSSLTPYEALYVLNGIYSTFNIFDKEHYSYFNNSLLFNCGKYRYWYALNNNVFYLENHAFIGVYYDLLNDVIFVGKCFKYEIDLSGDLRKQISKIINIDMKNRIKENIILDNYNKEELLNEYIYIIHNIKDVYKKYLWYQDNGCVIDDEVNNLNKLLESTYDKENSYKLLKRV